MLWNKRHLVGYTSMGIKSFFHKIKIGFARLGGASIPYVSSTKRYGNNGENSFIYELSRVLPSCKIKRNIIINSPDGNAEIDCLVLYENKLFAIEVKRWKGRLTEYQDGFVQEKTDRWTGETHIKIQKSPFKQLGRAIYLLRRQIEGRAWINAVVYFDDEDFEGVSTSLGNIWFNNIIALAEYIKNGGKITFERNGARKFFDKCVSADYLYSHSPDKSLHCIIDDKSLNFQTAQGNITRKSINYIKIAHHWSYDDLFITLTDGRVLNGNIENGKIRVFENGTIYEYSLCKLDYIELGK